MELCAVATFRGERRGQKRQRRRVRDTVGVGWGGVQWARQPRDVGVSLSGPLLKLRPQT